MSDTVARHVEAIAARNQRIEREHAVMRELITRLYQDGVCRGGFDINETGWVHVDAAARLGTEDQEILFGIVEPG